MSTKNLLGDRVGVYFELPTNLNQELAKFCACYGLTKTEFVIAALSSELDRLKKSASKKAQ